MCGKLMELPWNLCPYCGTPTPGMRRENLSLGEAMQSLTPAPLEDFELEESENDFEYFDSPEEEVESPEKYLDEEI